MVLLDIASKGKGKSGGARAILHVVYKDGTAYLRSIYDKSELENLTEGEILNLIKLKPIESNKTRHSGRVRCFA